jgi:hypothetical protein
MNIHLTEFAFFGGKFSPIFQPHKIGEKILDPWEIEYLGEWMVKLSHRA